MTADRTSQERASLLGGTMAVGASTAFRLASGFAISILIARLLGAEAKGQLALIQQVPAIAALVLGFGFEGAHAYFVGRHGRSAEGAVSDSLLLSGFAAAIGIPAALVIMTTWVPALDVVPPPTILIATAAIPMLVLSNLMAGVLTGQGRVDRQAFAQVVSAGVTLVAVMALALTGTLELGSYMVATLAGLFLGVTSAMASTKVVRVVRPSIARLREEFEYARRSYVQTVMGYLEVRQDVVLLGMLSTAQGVGIYTVGVSLAELLFYAPQTVASALTARSLQEGASSGASLTASVSRLLTAFIVVTTLILGLLVTPLVNLLFGAEFSAAAGVFWLLAPGIVIWGVASQPTAYLTTHGRLFPKMSTLALLINLGINLLLIPRYGFYGAAVATSVSYAVSSGYIIHTFLRTTEMHLGDIILPRRSDARLASGAARALVQRLKERGR